MIIVEVFWSSVLTPFVQGICGFVIGTKNKKCEINKWPTSFLEQAEIYLKDTFPTCHSHLAHQVYIFLLILLCYQDVSSIGFEVTNFTHSKLLNLEIQDTNHIYHVWPGLQLTLRYKNTL